MQMRNQHRTITSTDPVTLSTQAKT